MNKTDAEIEKALECCMETHSSCKDTGCPFQKLCLEDLDALQKYALDYINRLKSKEKKQQEEIERKRKHIAEIIDEYAKFKEAAKRREIARVRNIEQSADEEINRLKAENKELIEDNAALNETIVNLLEQIKTAKAEAIKEFEKLVTRRLNWNTPRGAYLLNIMNEVKKEMTEYEGKE
jgi:chromosome segregation ATPase